jgi:hypothetical protein
MFRECDMHILVDLLVGPTRSKYNQYCCKKASCANNLSEMFYLSLIAPLHLSPSAPVSPQIMRIIKKGGRKFII